RMRGQTDESGTLATFSFALDPAYNDESRDERISGLQLLNPVSVTVTQDDLPGLVLNPVALAGIRSIWPQVSGAFERILPSEILDQLERAAGQSLNSARQPISDDEFALFCAQNGLPNPGLERRQREQREQKAITEREAAEKEVNERRWQYAEQPADFYVEF